MQVAPTAALAATEEQLWQEDAPAMTAVGSEEPVAADKTERKLPSRPRWLPGGGGISTRCFIYL